MKREVVPDAKPIRYSFTQFQPLNLRFAFVLVCMLLIVTLYAMSEHNVLPDCIFFFFSFLFSILFGLYCLKFYARFFLFSLVKLMNREFLSITSFC
jgi:hypothetical protein